MDPVDAAREREEQAREAWQRVYNAMQDACSRRRWCAVLFGRITQMEYRVRLNIAWELQQARLDEWFAAIRARREAEEHVE